MNILITGGAGFIGSHLADALLERGDSVAVIDNLSTGSIRNLAAAKAHPRFTYTIGDVADRRLLAELVDDADVIFHLAAAVGVKLIVERPVHTISTNLKGTEVVLDLAAKKGKKVILASTSEVYGKSRDLPYSEGQDLVIGPSHRARWAYACSKAMDEFMALAYHREHGLPVVILRLFNTVGPRQTGRYGMVIPTFVGQALRGESITVYGDGEQRRCFAHVGDVVRCMVALLDAPAAVGRVVNIGSSQEISINDLAERVKALTKSASQITHTPYSEAYAEGFEDMRRRIPDTAQLVSLVGFAPDPGIDEIIRSVMEDKS